MLEVGSFDRHVFAQENSSLQIFGMVQNFVDLIFDLLSMNKNKICSKITGYTVLLSPILTRNAHYLILYRHINFSELNLTLL